MEGDGRESWDSYFLNMAAQAASRSTCVRRKVGAVIAQNNRVRSTGYNGGPSGYGHCSDGACPRGRQQASPDYVAGESGFVLSREGLTPEYEDCIAIHAEANALLQCEMLHREGATIYCTDFPCFSCAKLVSNSGIARLVYAGGTYEGWRTVMDFLRDCHVLVSPASIAQAD